MKFHVNDNGDVRPCKAHKSSCPFPESKHFPTKTEAETFYERTQSSKLFSTMRNRSKNITKKFVAVGGVFVATVSLSACGNMIDVKSQPQWQVTDEPSVTTTTEAPNNVLDEDTETVTITEDDSGSVSEVYFQGKPLKVSDEEVQDAREKLASLIEMDESLAGEYNRKELFGYNSSTVTGKIEHRDVTDGIFKSSSESSRAIGGTFIDPYTGEQVEVVEGSRTDTDIDHIVPLKEIYESENPYSPLTPEQRKQVANDPINLQIVGSSVNRSKSDKDAADWLPTYEPSQCTYVVSVITVKSSYRLTVDNAEKESIQQVLDTKC